MYLYSRMRAACLRTTSATGSACLCAGRVAPSRRWKSLGVDGVVLCPKPGRGNRMRHGGVVAAADGVADVDE